MKNDINIKSLWKEQQIPAANLSSIQKKVKCFKLRRIGEALTIVILMILVIVLGLIIWICWTPQLVTTQIGIILLTIGFALPILSYSRLLYLYCGLKEDCPSTDYINNLFAIKRQEKRQQHIVLTLYFLLLSLGFGLYIYEYTFYCSFNLGVISYAILLAWIALNWFIFRPYMIKKRNRQFADFMKYIERHKKLLK